MAMLAGGFGTMIGAWFKVMSSNPDRFYMSMIGQTITACSQVFILNLPARLAAVWFGPSEVSTACSIGVFGNQVKAKKCFVHNGIISHYTLRYDDVYRSFVLCLPFSWA